MLSIVVIGVRCDGFQVLVVCYNRCQCMFGWLSVLWWWWSDGCDVSVCCVVVCCDGCLEVCCGDCHVVGCDGCL